MLLLSSLLQSHKEVIVIYNNWIIKYNCYVRLIWKLEFHADTATFFSQMNKTLKITNHGWFGWRHVKVFTKSFHKNLRFLKSNGLPEKISPSDFYEMLSEEIPRGGSRAAATSKMERFVIIVNGCWWVFRKKSGSDLLRLWYRMKHPRGKLSFQEIPPVSVFSNLMGPQNEKPIRFLEIVTSYEAPRRKLNQNFSHNAFTRNSFVYRFL